MAKYYPVINPINGQSEILLGDWESEIRSKIQGKELIFHGFDSEKEAQEFIDINLIARNYYDDLENKKHLAEQINEQVDTKKKH